MADFVHANIMSVNEFIKLNYFFNFSHQILTNKIDFGNNLHEHILINDKFSYTMIMMKLQSKNPCLKYDDLSQICRSHSSCLQ